MENNFYNQCHKSIPRKINKNVTMETWNYELWNYGNFAECRQNYLFPKPAKSGTTGTNFNLKNFLIIYEAHL